MPEVDMPELDVARACDCHVHIVGPRESYPQNATRAYTAEVAALGSLRAAAEPMGVSRFVVVQPSFYGTDNACLLGALAALGENGRGVAAANVGDVEAERMEALAAKGVCGLRLNFYSKSGPLPAESAGDVLDAAIKKIPAKNWHVEIIAPISLLLKVADAIASSPVPIVLDHYGLPGKISPESCDGRRLLELAAMQHVWIKLTAPYRVLSDPLATTPPLDWLKEFLRVAPERCVWGSDWPHTPTGQDQKGSDQIALYRKLSYRSLLQNFLDALPHPALARRILVENPSRLYGFSPS